MDVQDAQRESRSVYIGGFWGQLVSAIIWLASAAQARGPLQKRRFWPWPSGDFSSFRSRN